MELLLQRLLETNFAELSGLRIDASVPLPERLLNEGIASALTGNPNISFCRVSIAEQNRLDVELKTPLWPWPLHLKLRLFGAVDITRSPIVRAFLENNVLLGKLGALLHALPPGVQLYENQVSIDVGVFIQSEEQKRLLTLIRSVNIQTEPGRIILDVHIEK